jgi:hypothetical protein
MKNNNKISKSFILRKLKSCEQYESKKIMCEELVEDFELKFTIKFDLSGRDFDAISLFCRLNGFIIQFANNSIQIIAFLS